MKTAKARKVNGVDGQIWATGDSQKAMVGAAKEVGLARWASGQVGPFFFVFRVVSQTTVQVTCK